MSCLLPLRVPGAQRVYALGRATCFSSLLSFYLGGMLMISPGLVCRSGVHCQAHFSCPDHLPVCFRRKTLEGPLHDTTVPPRGCRGLLRPTLVPLLRGRRDPAQPASALRPLQGPFRGTAPVPQLRTPVPHSGSTGGRGSETAQKDPESCAPPVFPEQHYLEAVAAAVLWNFPLVCMQAGRRSQ